MLTKHIWMGVFFNEKFIKILVAKPSPIKNSLSSFTLVSKDDVLKILLSSSIKTCDLDPIPNSLVKECADRIKAPMTNIINHSLMENSFPNSYVILLLKKQVWTETF